MSSHKAPRGPLTKKIGQPVVLELSSARNGYAFYALRLAELLSAQGITPKIVVKGPIVPLEPAWDARIRKHNWMQFCIDSQNASSYVFFGTPSGQQLLLNKNNDTKSIVVPSLNDIDAFVDPVLAAFPEMIACPSWTGIGALRNVHNVHNVTYLPMDLPVPFTRKHSLVDKAAVNLSIVCAGWPINKLMADSVTLAEELLDAYLNVHIDFMLYRSVPKPCRSRLQVLKNLYPERLTMTKASTLSTTLLKLMKCDLTVWMAHQDPTGMPALLSLYAGTPVLAYDVAPMNELIVNGRNSLLVPAELSDDVKAIPVVSDTPSAYKNFKDDIFKILNTKNSLKRLRAETHYDLGNRKILFDNGWRALLGL